MILPSKHIPQEKALLTVGAKLLNILNKPKTVSSLWEEVRQSSSETYDENTHLTYDWFILTIDFLYTIDAIEINEGLLQRKAS